MLEDDRRRGVEEAYTSAGNSSDLRHDASRPGAVDLLIAAGLSDSRLGMALLRLHSEWDKAEKPRKPTPAAINALAAVMPTTVKREGGGESVLTKSQRHEMARQRAQAWYLGEMASLVGKLRSLASVRHALATYAHRWKMEEAETKVPSIIAFWLDQTCSHCHGLKFLQAVGAPSLSTKACRACDGTGVARIPHAQDGRRIANYMDDCVSCARDALRKRLRALQPHA
ncbi:zinc finger-like domain-containing protein [Variovorax sp. UMC13]|uniref:zinc finger-like domain-containing protein n=1 Tax=Variovorax sp. UMC13 TaxID=1862326 RepID=UPI0016048162|nr:zinc finger-like domain-containing protein [Variovorax sp. UMC13]MBB1603326.1 hypothetical protein [Variovorax sp. UMC13]